MKQQDFYEILQDKLLDELVKRIESGEASAADLKLAKDYVKEAGIELYETNKKVVYLGKRFGTPEDAVEQIEQNK